MPENSGMAGWIYAGNISDGSVKNVMFTFTGGGNKLAPNIGVVVGTLDSGGGTATLYKVQTQSYAELSTMVTDEMVYGSNQTNNYYTFLPGYTNRWVYQLYHTDIWEFGYYTGGSYNFQKY